MFSLSLIVATRLLQKVHERVILLRRFRRAKVNRGEEHVRFTTRNNQPFKRLLAVHQLVQGIKLFVAQLNAGAVEHRRDLVRLRVVDFEDDVLFPSRVQTSLLGRFPFLAVAFNRHLARGLFDAVEFQVDFFNVARSRFDFQRVLAFANNWDVFVCFPSAIKLLKRFVM